VALTTLRTLERRNRPKPHDHCHTRQQYGDAASDRARHHRLLRELYSLVPYVNGDLTRQAPEPYALSRTISLFRPCGQYYTIRQLVTLTADAIRWPNFLHYIGSPVTLTAGGTGANPKNFYVSDASSSNINIITYSQVLRFIRLPQSNFFESLHLRRQYFFYSPRNFALPSDPGWTPSSSHR